jgi:hypothetical protein
MLSRLSTHGLNYVSKAGHGYCIKSTRSIRLSVRNARGHGFAVHYQYRALSHSKVLPVLLIGLKVGDESFSVIIRSACRYPAFQLSFWVTGSEERAEQFAHMMTIPEKPLGIQPNHSNACHSLRRESQNGVSDQRSSNSPDAVPRQA